MSLAVKMHVSILDMIEIAEREAYIFESIIEDVGTQRTAEDCHISRHIVARLVQEDELAQTLSVFLALRDCLT